MSDGPGGAVADDGRRAAGVGDRLGHAGERAEQAARALRQVQVYRAMVRIGLVAYGVVHLLVAVVALQLALGVGRQEASSTGAMAEVATQPLGVVLLGAIAVGLVTLALWKVLEALLGHREAHGFTRVRRKASALGTALLYLVLAATAVRVAAGARPGTARERGQDLAARLLDHPVGVGLVLLVAAGVAGFGVAAGIKGLRRTFREDLSREPGPVGLLLGVVGHVTKGVAYLVVASLLVAAVLTSDAERAGGLDLALRAVRAQVHGGVLLTLVALGLAAYGLYCFGWARAPRHR
ncbi:DUF1206 domain-containing protein [Desertihabitans brevis]|uniref:DUF1206 domain-containing protein n=1 Tax=Desertihabitans brevis TaxID=2268447 RepID=A0A367YZ94_9ACTN|nr:DUF1206 domain-containing protein [Desertihabitans brevis]RCK71243.1 DUF1206 domain-containing protein [Desertihabitans brevis]